MPSALHQIGFLHGDKDTQVKEVEPPQHSPGGMQLCGGGTIDDIAMPALEGKNSDKLLAPMLHEGSQLCFLVQAQACPYSEEDTGQRGDSVDSRSSGPYQQSLTISTLKSTNTRVQEEAGGCRVRK